MGTWMNSDGLYIKLGVDEGTVGKAGTFGDLGSGQHVLEANITLTSLGTAAAIIDDNAIIPSGYVITRVQVIATTAATSGGAAVLNIGIQRRDRSTEGDYDGYVAALPLANINVAGETNDLTAGVTYAGALVGTAPSYSGYLTADYDTAAFTAGVVKVRVFLQKI